MTKECVDAAADKNYNHRQFQISGHFPPGQIC